MKNKDYKKTKKYKRDENREIGIITYAFLSVFVVLILYLGVFVQFRSAEVVNNNYNKRQNLLEQHIIRGNIYSADGEILATSVLQDDGEYHRYYPFGKEFAHVVGYSTHGVLGIESSYNFRLLKSNSSIIKRVETDLMGKKNQGDSVYTTLQENLQRAAYDSLGDNKGAVIAVDAQTGEILAMVSKPDFDPNDIENSWDDYNDDSLNSPLLNRATLGLYPPGSTFKIVTALAYIKENKGKLDEYSFNCNGSINIDGSNIRCYHGISHGELDFKGSFAKSCNSSFANLTSTLDKSEFEECCNSLLFNGELPLNMPYSKGVTTISANSDTDELLQSGIGQGKTLVSPIQMTMITSAIANDGVLMEPYLVSEIKSDSDKKIYRGSQKVYGRIIDSNEAAMLEGMMYEVVESGTATKLKDADGYIAGGKTGSAEYSADKSKSHAWFTGFATDAERVIVVTVVVENGGSGGEVAVPIANSVFDAYY